MGALWCTSGISIHASSISIGASGMAILDGGDGGVHTTVTEVTEVTVLSQDWISY